VHLFGAKFTLKLKEKKQPSNSRSIQSAAAKFFYEYIETKFSPYFYIFAGLSLLKYMTKQVTSSSILKILPHKKIEKENKTLLINPKTGSWCVLENTTLPLLSLIEGKKLEQISFYKTNKEAFEKFVLYLYHYGILAIDGSVIQKVNCLALEQKNPFSLIVLKVTNKCNLKCSYCYNEGFEQSEYPPNNAVAEEQVEKNLESALKYCDKGLVIAFHGGEPFLRFDLITKVSKKILKKAQDMNKEVEFCIQTNATLLTPEIINYIKTEKIGLGISLDGPAEINDANRKTKDGKGSSAKLFKNLSLLKDSKINVNILSVVNNLNARRLADNVSFFQEQGFKSVKFSFFFKAGNASSLDNSMPTPEDAIFGFKDLITRIQKKQIWDIQVDNIITYIRNIVCRDGFSMCDRSPCGAAKDMVVLFPSGNVYACDCLVDPAFKLGNLNKTTFENLFNNSVVEKLNNRRVENLTSCKKCYLRNTCGGTMTCRAYWSGGKLNSTDKGQCQLNKSIIEDLMWKLVEGPQLMEYFFRHNPDKTLAPAKFYSQ
jgi:uncharacterized protein